MCARTREYSWKSRNSEKKIRFKQVHNACPIGEECVRWCFSSFFHFIRIFFDVIVFIIIIFRWKIYSFRLWLEYLLFVYFFLILSLSLTHSLCIFYYLREMHEKKKATIWCAIKNIIKKATHLKFQIPKTTNEQTN